MTRSQNGVTGPEPSTPTDRTQASHTARPNGAGNGKGARNGAANGTARPKPLQYNCAKCPGYCCSYPVIVVSWRDVERLARRFAITPEEAERRFTRSGHGHKRIMRRKADPHFGKICRFFDTEKRRCTAYEARPAVCRSFPGDGRCGYYDFLTFERRAQNDPNYVASTDHR
jgi:Fe-S-cluster containining protein